MNIRRIEDLPDISGKFVLVRADYNVPVTKGKVGSAEARKLRATMPTIKYLINRKAKVVVVSHLGRPEGRERKFSLKPVADRLAKILERKVLFVSAGLDEGDKVDQELEKMKDGQVALLENIRFYPGEKKNDKFLSKRLAGLADYFVNDAFATAHRKHASTAGVTRYLPSYAGKLMESEIHNLGRLLGEPKKPFEVLMGGEKISSKLPTLQSLLKVADEILIGGGMANSFFRAKGYSIGKSRVSKDDVNKAKKLLSKRKIILPKDVIAATSQTSKAKVRIAAPNDIRKNEYVLDVGPQTVLDFSARIKKARTIAWNGPVGLFEVKKFSHGTVALGRIIAARANGKAFAVVGGGETIMALQQTGMSRHIDHVSTGGGAMLEFLTGKTLPGIKPLLEK